MCHYILAVNFKIIPTTCFLAKPILAMLSISSSRGSFVYLQGELTPSASSQSSLEGRRESVLET